MLALPAGMARRFAFPNAECPGIIPGMRRALRFLPLALGSVLLVVLGLGSVLLVARYVQVRWLLGPPTPTHLEEKQAYLASLPEAIPETAPRGHRAFSATRLCWSIGIGEIAMTP